MLRRRRKEVKERVTSELQARRGKLRRYELVRLEALSIGYHKGVTPIQAFRL
jgi:hypothetical protein